MNNHKTRDMDTKARILRAAVTEFAEQGYRGATVRGIVTRAGASNLNSVVYYFGGKEGLYKAVLEFMFLEADNFRDSEEERVSSCGTPEERLAGMIRFLCRAIYSIRNDVDRALYAIFVKEVGAPTPMFNEMVERYLRPSKEKMCSLLREFLGADVPRSTIEACEYSISAQILHGALGWSIISRTFPEQAPFETRVDELAEHVVRFSLGGLERFRK